MTWGLVLNRRQLLRTTVIGGLAAGLPIGAITAAAAGPALLRADRPVLTHGVQSGDVLERSGLVWARADRPSRLFIEVSTRPDLNDAYRITGPVLTADTDYTGKVRVRCDRGRTVYYRVMVEDLDRRSTSEPVTGSFRVPPARDEGVRFVWSGDIVGQGWGINPDDGGMRIFAAMRERDPDFFICSGDTVYADGPLREAVTLADGRIWRNVVTAEKSKVAETLGEFRGQYAYNLLDEHLRAFVAAVPQVNQWDDHEVINNWYPGEVLTDDRYTERRVDVLASRALQAFHEWVPLDPRRAVDGRIYRRLPYGPHIEVFMIDMRSYRDANSANTAPYERILGERQARWLVHSLAASRATWKIVASDLPIGLLVPDGTMWEAVANGTNGPPSGREAEMAWVLQSLQKQKVRNVVWLTADVHYTAAHRYSPAGARFTEFDEFWEFVSGPLHAGGFEPNQLDATFGPAVEFVKAPSASNTSPLDGFQHFGEVEVAPGGATMRVSLRNRAGAELWSTMLDRA
ncbi:MAG TPA: alkaline phosphatase D family protein [Pseudonocardiaceae bacterium]|nr:alkaline phosphatase D family protein [Pseudonocardiaceae bacterium]